MKEQNEHCRKTSYKKVGYDLKLLIIDQIQNAIDLIKSSNKPIEEIAIRLAQEVYLYDLEKECQKGAKAGKKLREEK